MSILTDIDANRHYCACMCFNETVSITPSKPVDEEEDPVDGDSRTLVKALPAIAHHSIMYAPKCLVLVSRLDYIETFRVSNFIQILFYKQSKDFVDLNHELFYFRIASALFILFMWKILEYLWKLLLVIFWDAYKYHQLVDHKSVLALVQVIDRHCSLRSVLLYLLLILVLICYFNN